MSIQPTSPLLQNIHISDIVAYLRRTQWQSAKPYKKGIQVFQGPPDIHGDPLEIVLPIDEQSPDKAIYAASALNLLSAVNEDDPEHLLQQIKLYDRDVLRIRNMYTGAHGTIDLTLAAIQVLGIKQLLAYAACSEDNPRPSYQEVSKRAARIVKNFQFAHTFPGSFGFAIEVLVGDQQELPLFSTLEPLDVQKYIIPPIERRVMERLIRGLLSLQEALLRHDPLIIVREYSAGLNANMCRAMLQMSDHHRIAMEYQIAWSPKIQPSSDIAHSGPIILDGDAYLYLSTALEELKKFPLQEITIIGNVTGLISKDDPMGSDETPRLVMIRGVRKDGTSINVAVVLSKKDYVLAHDAHLNWRTVEMSGELVRMGNSWELSHYRDFHILSNNPESIPLI